MCEKMDLTRGQTQLILWSTLLLLKNIVVQYYNVRQNRKKQLQKNKQNNNTIKQNLNKTTKYHGITKKQKTPVSQDHFEQNNKKIYTNHTTTVITIFMIIFL